MILCDCEISAFVNRVSSTAKQIQNRGRAYYWCSKKAVKPAGVDADKLNAHDFALYKDKCDFFCGVTKLGTTTKWLCFIIFFIYQKNFFASNNFQHVNFFLSLLICPYGR